MLELNFEISKNIRFKVTCSSWLKNTFNFVLANNLYQAIKFRKFTEIRCLLKNIQGSYIINIFKDEILKIIISDETSSIDFLLIDNLQNQKTKILSDSKSELLCFGYCLNEKIIGSNAKRITPNSIAIKYSKNWKVKNFFNIFYSYNSVKFSSKTLHNILKFQLSEFLKKIGNRQVVVPLSGGYDSRLILVLLYELKVENVICYTYGSEKHEEVQISENVAKTLGYYWKFIKYDSFKISSFIKSDEYSKFIFSHNYAIPHIQDFYAVKELMKDSMVENDAIFLPGHSADFVAGSHIPILKKNKIYTKLDLKFRILYDHGINNYRKAFYFIFKNFLNTKKRQFKYDEFINEYEYWDYYNRQISYITKSCKVYQHFGFEYYMIFWNNSIANYFLSLRLTERTNRERYCNFVNNLSKKYSIEPLPIKIKNKENYMLLRLFKSIIWLFIKKPISEKHYGLNLFIKSIPGKNFIGSFSSYFLNFKQQNELVKHKDK